MKLSELKKQSILDYINEYYDNYCKIPTVRDIAAGTEIPSATVQRYLVALKEDKKLEYNGKRSIQTKRIKMESKTTSLPVIKCITNDNDTVIRQEITEYIRLPESMIGKGKFFALVVKDDAMIDMGIFPGDYVIVKEASNIRDNDIVVISFNGLDIVRKIQIKEDKTVLISCNKDKEKYPDIIPDNQVIKGIVAGKYHFMESFSNEQPNE